MVVLRVLVFIGCLTGLWRSSGTIAFFVYHGLKLITPNIFLLAAFLMATVMSLTFGSAFGVAGTAGVILSVIARTGGADLAMTAGAVVSGAYLGERLSPASSSSALASALAGTDQNAMQRRMWRTTPLPLALSLIFYGVLSVLFPIRQVDPTILNALQESFDLSWWTVIPAVILLALPFFHVKAVWAILISCGVSVVVAVLLQGVGWLEALQISVFGCELDHPELASILSGGGVVSMVNGMLIVLFSCTSSGILKGAGLLDPVKEKLEHLTERTDLFFTTALVSLASAALLPRFGQHGHPPARDGPLVHRGERAPGRHGRLGPGHSIRLFSLSLPPVRRAVLEGQGEEENGGKLKIILNRCLQLGLEAFF